MPENPSVGRVVHYVLPEQSAYAGQHRAATIVQVWQPLDSESATAAPGMSNLSVAKAQAGDFDGVQVGAIAESDTHILLGSILFSEEPRPGTWHWPERVPAVAACKPGECREASVEVVPKAD